TGSVAPFGYCPWAVARECSRGVWSVVGWWYYNVYIYSHIYFLVLHMKTETLIAIASVLATSGMFFVMLRSFQENLRFEVFESLQKLSLDARMLEVEHTAFLKWFDDNFKSHKDHDALKEPLNSIGDIYSEIREDVDSISRRLGGFRCRLFRSEVFNLKMEVRKKHEEVLYARQRHILTQQQVCDGLKRQGFAVGEPPSFR
ncbi:hypothetical protein NPJ88_013830, partial [Halomonas elongata]|uniref:hypothetical protein n=1 Tax=Halomonas elongata TaxID=2746 RepID=UPI00255ABDAC